MTLSFFILLRLRNIAEFMIVDGCLSVWTVRQTDGSAENLDCSDCWRQSITSTALHASLVSLDAVLLIIGLLDSGLTSKMALACRILVVLVVVVKVMASKLSHYQIRRSHRTDFSKFRLARAS
jgi:hypothetical protein